MKRPRVLVAAAAACAVVALAAAGVSVWALSAGSGAPLGRAGVVADSGASGDGNALTREAWATGSTGIYSFGHTIDSAVPSPDAPLDASMRLPFSLSVPAQAFRVHVRNWSFDDEREYDSPVTLTGMHVGAHALDPSTATGQTGAFEGTPVGIVGTVNLARGGFVSEWIEPSRMALDASVDSLLAIGFTAPAGARLATSQGLSWTDVGEGAAALAGGPGVRGAPQYLSYFDVWIEYGFGGSDADPPPVLVSVGHSLNAPGSFATEAFPTRGESTAWPQQWALSHGGVAVSLAAPGAEASAFAPSAAKWEAFSDVSPDIVTIWTASNDIARGHPLAEIERDWSEVVAGVVARWPDAAVFALTEPPRGLTGAEEQTRLAWNEWLSLVPPGVDGVLDADAVLRDPGARSLLRADVDADGVHFSARGHALVAELVPVPVPPPVPVPVPTAASR
ncbi:SGNH/GDSL hydrolase family protein [Herbiconiux sp. CPCC 203407]|uniref:SGNH/GDSL hydrolase family protein n=1 Tax=Herbiconiux oxytropis TaxID=2970915 RepID=A0AA41XBM1_9MICO|nr:SGNH/GDSL hydrolase family protein [Herbiconiux oxytropis]MCS5722986.1 SGNH/GDSL hydrolase family protein [Herbiconiux oxytropis]MCS5725202.1 SGNH/GDSL hydrolase family protein [Herbiconiux oxytropis]